MVIILSSSNNARMKIKEKYTWEKIAEHFENEYQKADFKFKELINLSKINKFI